MKRFILPLIVLSVGFVSCAKNRGVEKAHTGVTEKWMRKSDYTGTGDTADTYYAKWTVVKNTYGNNLTFVGQQGDMAVGYFDIGEKSMAFRSLGGMYKGRPTASVQAPVLYQWGITHHSAQLQSVDGKTTNKEVDDDRLNWKAKTDFEVKDFGADAELLPVMEGGCWEQKGSHEVENTREVTPGYISFVVEVLYAKRCAYNPNDGVNQTLSVSVQYRYSFLKRTATSYEPMVFEGENDARMRKFGYFQSIKEERNGNTDQPLNIFLVNRWDPKKEHNYYFAEGFPEQYKYIFRDIFDKTNEMFAKKGLKVRFHMRDNTWGDGKPKHLGDLRYSFINLMEEYDETAPLGYGPSDADPFTGEIISGTVNVWSGLIKWYLQILEKSSDRNPKWFANAQGQWDVDFDNSKWAQSDLYVKMKDLMQEDPRAWTEGWDDRPELGNFFREMTEKTTYVHPLANPFTSGSFQNAPVQTFVEIPSRDSLDGVKSKMLGDVKDLIGTPMQNDWISSLSNLNVHMGEGPLAIPSLLIGYKPFENNSLMQELMKRSHNMPDISILENFSKEMAKYEEKEKENISANLRGHCILDAQASFSGLESAFISGFSPAEVVENILYRVGIHEFGHNLNLRHNFYGSVDKKNFLKPSVPMFAPVLGADGKATGKRVPVLDANGQQKKWPTISSSVMDYLRLQDDFFSTQGWEPYDVAALSYAYSDGRLDDKQLYMYCSDEHTFTSAFCNRFDHGSSPTEIVASFIESYEDSYYTGNYRLGRAYWDTSGYMSKILTTMREMKEFIPMWRTAFYDANLREQLKAQGKSKDESNQTIIQMNREIKQSIKLMIAFYQAVLQTANTDKPYRSVYTDNGSLERLGVTSDKLAAMYFLAGDDPIYYNPNRVMLDTSILSYSYVPEFAPLLNKVFENLITQRVDMEPWFISMGRAMYATAAMNYSNRYDQGFINKLKIKRYTNLEINDYFNVNLEDNSDSKVFAKLVTLERSKDPDFRKGEEVAIVSYKTNFYVFSKQESSYAFDIYKNIINAKNANLPTSDAQMDLEELYLVYSLTTGGIL
jgi:hypothetical protein